MFRKMILAEHDFQNHNSMRQFITMMLFIVCSALGLQAQTFTERLLQRNAGWGTISISHSAEIDALVNGKSRELSSAVPSALPSDIATGDSTTASASTPTAFWTRTYKTTGYRVQVLAGGNSRADKNKVTVAGNKMKTMFPDESVYVHFYSPRWICRLGNYRTYEEAHQMLRKVQELGYNQATIVKGKITLRY